MKPDFKTSPKTRFKPVDRLDEDEAKREAEALREGIDHHDFLYYVKNSPAIGTRVSPDASMVTDSYQSRLSIGGLPHPDETTPADEVSGEGCNPLPAGFIWEKG